MLKKITIVLGFLVGSILAAQSQSDPSSSLSHLSPGVAISGTDLFYDVQVPGVGGVKVTGTQFLSWVFGNVSGNCTSSISGVFSCTGGNATGIAAGTNIATSGSTVNVTVNTTLTPTFTSVSTTLASVTGWLTAAGVNAQTETIAGALIGSTANFSGNLTGTTGNFTGNLTSTTHQVPGFLTASGGSFNTITILGNLTAGSGSFATSLTAGTIQATGFLTASGANFTTLTVTGLTPTGPNCLQETGGLLQATNSACSTPAISIAAGSNISTSGTASNVSVSVIPNPTFTSLTSTIAAFPSWITVGGANILTATISGNLTGSTANFSSNLTANIAQFPGFLTASGASLNTATIAGNLTGSTAQFSGLLTGTTAVFQTVTIKNLTPTGPNCLQETGGVVQATNAACGSGGGTPGGANTNVQFNDSSTFGGDAGFIYSRGSGQVGVKSAGGYGLSSLTSATTQTIDTMLYRDGTVSALALADFATNTNPTAFRVYNTTDNVSTNVAPTNWERGVFDWTTTNNVLTIGVQNGGTGTARPVTFVFGGHLYFQDASSSTVVAAIPGGGIAFQAHTTWAIGWGNSTADAGGFDTGFTRVSQGVVGFYKNGTNTGWFNWAGQARLSADFGSTTTTLAAVTATGQSLTVNLQANRNYSFHTFLPFSTGAAAGGIKASFGGTATATNFIADGICSDGASGLTVTRIALITNTFVATTNAGTTPKCEIDGTFEVNGAGTFLVQFAQNTQTGASTVTRGAYMTVNDTP